MIMVRARTNPSRVYPRSVARPGMRGKSVRRTVRSADFDVLPEPETVGDLLHPWKRRLIRPSSAGVTRTVDDHVVELDAVRAGAVRIRLIRLLQPFGAHRRGREILIAVAFDDVVALGDHVAFQARPHVKSSTDAERAARPGYIVEGACPQGSHGLVPLVKGR